MHQTRNGVERFSLSLVRAGDPSVRHLHEVRQKVKIAVMRSILISLLLSAIATALAQSDPQPKPIPSRRLVSRGEMYHPLSEIRIDLSESAGRPGDEVAMRICSRDPLPVAIFTAVMSPLGLGWMLIHDKNSGITYPQDHVLILRSPDCPVPDPPYVPVEFWGVPRGAALPPAAESVKWCQVKYESFSPRRSFSGLRSYKVALKHLLAKLRENPEVVAVIQGDYDVHPNVSMQRALKEAEEFFERSGVARGRYFVRLKPSAVYDPEYHREPERKYPNVIAVWIAEGCNEK